MQNDKKRKVLMSIRPKYVDEILDKKKLFEFRRAVFDASSVDSVVIYASSPIKKIVAEFNVSDIMAGTPESIWNQCQDNAGIGRDAFMEYFADKDTAFSIRPLLKPIYKMISKSIYYRL
jgi:predicted transcriptional regulator